mgnify:CR=1 FL=1
MWGKRAFWLMGEEEKNCIRFLLFSSFPFHGNFLRNKIFMKISWKHFLSESLFSQLDDVFSLGSLHKNDLWRPFTWQTLTAVDCIRHFRKQHYLGFIYSTTLIKFFVLCLVFQSKIHEWWEQYNNYGDRMMFNMRLNDLIEL